MWNSFEKRKFPRIEKECGITINAAGKNEAFQSVTENVGLGGCCLHLAKPLDPFSRARLKLVLESGAEPFECDARVVWCIQQRNFDPKLVSYDIGFEFLEMSPSDRARLQQFLLPFA